MITDESCRSSRAQAEVRSDFAAKTKMITSDLSVGKLLQRLLFGNAVTPAVWGGVTTMIAGSLVSAI